MEDEILTRVILALTEAKRVRRESTLVVQILADLRDELTATATGGTSTNASTNQDTNQ